jgi:hypothetical protein
MPQFGFAASWLCRNSALPQFGYAASLTRVLKIRGVRTMASASRPLVPVADLSRADQLRRRLLDFVTSGPLKTEYEQECKTFVEMSDRGDPEESASICDWFMFDWFDDEGFGAIERFVSHHDDLSDSDVEILYDWEDSIHSIFEVRSVAGDRAQLRDMDSGDTFPVSTTSQPGGPQLERRQFITTRLLPLGKGFVFSGPIVVLPDKEAALEALELNRALEAMNSPEAIEQAQREQCDAFHELFGCDEVSLGPSELNVTLERFQRYMLFERREPETNMSRAEMFKAQFGHDLKLPHIPPLAENFEPGAQVSILCDEFDGIVILPEYERFKRVFEAKDCDRAVRDSLDLLWAYIKEPEIPTVAFERVAEQTPEGVERVLRIVLGDDDFSIEHLYVMLVHYKEPLDGLDDLEDDERLWDLLDGNGGKASKPAKASKGKTAARSSKTAIASRKAPSSSKTAPAAKKAAPSPRKAAAASGRAKPSSKSKADKPAARSSARKKQR